jgi:PST family polysaccharide transporter
VVLAFRQVVGLATGTLSAIAFARIIGAEGYGIYVTAAAITLFVAAVFKLGTSLYLISREAAPSEQDYQAAFTFTLLVAMMAVLLTWPVALLAGAWLDDQRFVAVLLAMTPASFMTVLSEPAFARLERDLRFTDIASAELTTEITQSALGITLAVVGFGYWAPVIGMTCARVVLGLSIYYRARLRPRLRFAPAEWRILLLYGLRVSAPQITNAVRTAIAPVLVGGVLGTAAVGYFNIAGRLVSIAQVATDATTRVSYAAFAHLQADAQRLRAALEESMVLQAAVGGFCTLAISLLGWLPFLLVFGDEWRPAWELFPWLAVGGQLTAIAAMPKSVTMIKGKALWVGASDVLELSIFAAAGVLLASPFGLQGFAYARLLSFVALVVVHVICRRLTGYSPLGVLPWFGVFAVASFANPVVALWAPVLALAPLSLLCFPGTRRDLVRVSRTVRSVVEPLLARVAPLLPRRRQQLGGDP